MDFLNKAFEQIKDLFASMTPGARITAGLLVAVIVVALVFLFRSGVAGPDDYLLGGRAFSSAELEAMEGAFAQAGLSNYQLEGSRVRIPSSTKAQYLAALAEHQALPANFSDHFSQQITQATMFETKEQANLRWRLAKQQELALIISSMQGVSRAQVIYDEVQKTGFPRTTEKTATVAVQATGNLELELHQVKSIRHLVSSAIAGMKFQSVTVTDLNTGKNYGGGDSELASAEESAYMDYKNTYERQWADKISKALAFVSGAVVTVDVELSKETVFHEDTMTVDPKPVVLRSTTLEKSNSTARAAAAGRPGVNGQANQQASITSERMGESTNEESREDLERVGGRGRIVKSTAPLVPKKVTAAVGVPSSYYSQVWRERNPTPAGEEPKAPEAQAIAAIEAEVIKKIEDMIVNLIPKLPAGEDKYPLVTVKTFEHLTAPPAELPNIASTAGVWVAENWKTLGMFLVGAFSLLMLRSMVKARPESTTPNAAATPAAAPQLSVVGGDDEDESDAAGEEGRPKKRFATAGSNIKEELASMVRENPEAAANILRGWLGEAS
jgi:flagellar M-ring protein FliF